MPKKANSEKDLTPEVKFKQVVFEALSEKWVIRFAIIVVFLTIIVVLLGSFYDITFGKADSSYWILALSYIFTSITSFFLGKKTVK